MPRPFRKAKLGQTDMQLRDQAILMKRLQGETVEKVAAEFNASRRTVQRALARAREQNIVQIGRGYVLTDILGPALGTLKVACESGDTETSLRIVELLGVIGKYAREHEDAIDLATGGGGDRTSVIEEFEVFRRRVLKRGAAEERSSFDQADIIDAVTSESNNYANPAASGRHPADALDQGGEADRPERLQGLLPGPAGSRAGDQRLADDCGPADAQAGPRPRDAGDDEPQE